MRRLRKRLEAVRARLGKLTPARAFRHSRTLYLRARARAATNPDRKARLTLLARKSQGLGDRIEHTQHILHKREKRLQAALVAKSFSTNWGGSQGAFEELVRKAGLPRPYISSLKRSASNPLSISNPGSDHNEANTTAYAGDFATTDGEGYARRVAKAARWQEWQPGSYVTKNYKASDGNYYRIQILWHVQGHYDHVHVGVRRV